MTMDYLSLFQLASAVAATLSTGAVLALYLVLVPLHRNPGAKRLAFLLFTIFIILSLTLARIFFGDYPGRLNILATFFFILTLSMAWLARHIWRDQMEGALRHRQAKRDRSFSE